ncbi:MAG: hypothetical protein HQK66_12220 [Desulfamplus sp.]|nr:hypothetical protein [Desulfamplus sp.]
MILKHAVQYSPMDYFFDPYIWKTLSPANLTPWITLSYDIDWVLFGWSPYHFYLHHLISLCISALVLYSLFRLYFSQIHSFMGSLIVLCSLPFADIAHHLYKRHYLEGLIFASLTVIFYVKALGRREPWWLICATLFYIFAMTAKEIYVPIVVMLLFLPEAPLKVRLRYLIPLILSAFFYVLWRRYMLGVFVGGYETLSPDFSILTILDIVHSILDGLNYSNWFQYCVLLIVTGVPFLIGGIAISLPWKFFWMVLIAAAVLPVIPVLSMFSPHYFLIPYCIVTALLVAFYNEKFIMSIPFCSMPKLISIIFSFSVLFIFFCMNFLIVVDAKWKSPFMDRIRAEGEFMLEQDGNDAYMLKPLLPYWHHHGLAWFRNNIFERSGIRGVIQDDCTPMFPFSEPGDGLYRFDGRKITPFMESDSCFIKEDAPLDVMISYTENFMISWHLGPYESGVYYIYAMEGETQMGNPMERSGDMRIFLDPQAERLWQVKYLSPDGWATYSPYFKVEPQENRNNSSAFNIIWKR